MTDLETALRTIYDEKMTKLIPENIKAGVTILRSYWNLHRRVFKSRIINERRT